MAVSAGWLHAAGAASLVLLTSAVQAQCLEFNGAQEQGGFIWGKVAPGSSVSLDGQELDVLPDGTTFAGFGRNAPSTAELVVSGSRPCSETLQVASREYNIQRVEGVPQETVTPPPERMARIRREATLVANARAPSLQRPDLLRLVGGQDLRDDALGRDADAGRDRRRRPRVVAREHPHE